MPVDLESYLTQVEKWPASDRVILAQFDSDSVVVYQAYRPAIGRFAAKHGYFGGEFKLGRMTWIKPNFLWMMYRSNWGRSADQEVVLAIRMRRSAFETVLRRAVHSSFRPEVYGTEAAWRDRLASSDVRLQWDPDHAPDGEPVARRAIQLGLGGDTARAYARDWIVGIEDISELVAAQRDAFPGGDYTALMTPRERPYPVDAELAAHLELPPPAT